MSDITFKLTAATNVGLVRSNNEDNFIVNPNLSDTQWLIPKDRNKGIELGKFGCLLVVADGMGGMNAGEVASAIAVETVKDIFSSGDLKKAVRSTKSIINFLEKAIVKADSNIKAKVKEDETTSGMGTTIVIAWILEQNVYVSWCGDSRAYLYNASSGLSRLSKDHSYVQQLVDDGKLDPELAFDHPNSNIITRSLGDSHSAACPESTYKKLAKGDYVILCSDGICGLIRDNEMLDVIKGSNPDDIEEVKTNLMSAALNAGGYDNLTVALFQCVKTIEGDINATLVSFRNKESKLEVKEQQEQQVLQGQQEKQTEQEIEPGTELFSLDVKPVDNVDAIETATVRVSEEDSDNSENNVSEKKRKNNFPVWIIIVLIVLATLFFFLFRDEMTEFLYAVIEQIKDICSTQKTH